MCVVTGRAQTNRTYKTDMQNSRIKADEQRPSYKDTGTHTRLNTGSNRLEDPRYTRDTATAPPQDHTQRSTRARLDSLKTFDTSLTNGRIIGVGSGSTRDTITRIPD